MSAARFVGIYHSQFSRETKKMAFRWLLISVIIFGKKVLTLNIVNSIFYQKDEINNLTFSLDHRAREKAERAKIHFKNGEISYVYSDNGISSIFTLTAEKDIKEFFSLNEDIKSCDYFITKGGLLNREKKHKCFRETFCGIVPNFKYIKKKKKENDILLYCAYFNETHVIIYHVGKPKILEPNITYENIFFEKDKKGIINCYAMDIDIRYVHVYATNECVHNYFLEYIRETCQGKKYCELDFTTIKNGENCPMSKNIFITVQYTCEATCNPKLNEICDIHNSNGLIRTCKYGYNMAIELSDECERNYTCGNSDICSVNAYCNESSKTCKCKNSLLPFISNNCVYNDICKVLTCPENSTCEKVDNEEKGECKCQKDKYFYKNKCYNKYDLELAIKMELPIRRRTYYEHTLYDGLSLRPEHIYMQCENGYYIEVVNAYASCYHVSFEKNYMKYITDYLKRACNGKTRCAYGNSIDAVEHIDIDNMCNEHKVIFHYEYLCAQDDKIEKPLLMLEGSTLPLTSPPQMGIIAPGGNDMRNLFVQMQGGGSKVHTEGQMKGAAKRAMERTVLTPVAVSVEEINPAQSYNRFKRKSEIFRSRFSSKIRCDGGTITVTTALLKTGDGCEDLNMTSSVKSYCDGLSDCDIGLTHHFDTYCINDQYLFVSYECLDLCTYCPPNSSCYGNKYNYKCLCDSPYISIRNNTACQAPTNCSVAVCGKNQVCKQINNDQFICECNSGYKNVNGTCVIDDNCDLLCPSNKSCMIENGEKICRCTNGLSLVNGVCVCSDDHIINNENLCIPKNKCKRKEYTNICKNKNEECSYDEKEDIVKCVCMEHYFRTDRGDCKPINYCENLKCNENEECKIVNYKATCECKQNLKRNTSGQCVYNNLCLINNGNCPIDSNCMYYLNKPHECVCHKQGFVPHKGKCVLLDKCNEGNTCSENSICVNVMNKEPICICTFNYFKKDGLCIIQNPCLKDNGGCSRNSNCIFKNNKITCACKENYLNLNNSCVPKTTNMDKSFTFTYNKDVSIVLGNCAIIELLHRNNQIIWKTNYSNESYIFNYEFPTSGQLIAQIKNQFSSSILYLKKKAQNNFVYDDFHMEHKSCKYENVFFYSHRGGNA
ncbi:Rh5 interacting protein, putative [Plasmodium malariae]|uniref:Rh5 interacting protein, putative n=1 Tax=Plasmodium malariae TaxID=5858 RepID=A0A1C3KYB3_PLAMA|nr:Rh5 interacting protein, putative [Plasmodium malariae]